MKEYIEIINKNMQNEISKEIMIHQIQNFYKIKESLPFPQNNYQIGDKVKLKKGTFLHGTYKNLDGLKAICQNGLISSWFIDGRLSKYPSSVGVWNLKKDYLLKDYINFYSGGTIMYCGVSKKGLSRSNNKTAVIPYNEMPNILAISSKINCHMWTMEQTKEARFLPSLVQDKVQIGIIFNMTSKEAKKLLQGDILNPKNINDNAVKEFVNPDYYSHFIKLRKRKDDFFTDRESAILFGVPANLIEGVLVGRKYEKNNKILVEIKDLIHGGYICNLDGKVIF